MSNLKVPKISIIVTCYNLGEYLPDAVTSAVNVNYSNYEIIIVNDGSTQQSTKDVLKEIEDKYSNDKRILIIHQENKGLSAARNIGIERSTGEFFLPLDADNKLRPDYLKRASSVMASDPTIGVVYAYAQRFGEQNDIWEFGEFDIYDLLQENQVEACSLVRRKVWEDCGGFDGDLFRIGYEDWDFWLGAYEEGWKFHLIKEVLFDYRVRKDSMVTFCSIPENWELLTRNLRAKHSNLYRQYWPKDYFVKEGKLWLLETSMAEHMKGCSAIKESEECLKKRVIELENQIEVLEKVKKEHEEILKASAPIIRLYLKLTSTKVFKALRSVVKAMKKNRGN